MREVMCKGLVSAHFVLDLSRQAQFQTVLAICHEDLDTVPGLTSISSRSEQGKSSR